MRFEDAPIVGAFYIMPERIEDERGFFARTWCRRDFKSHGIDESFVQSSVSFNLKKGTLRGMHFQAKPMEEAKLVRCTAGAIFDVIVDVRAESPSFRRWYAVELSGANGAQVFIPKGVAHGFQTLIDRTEVLYQMSEYYSAEWATGFRYDDPTLAIPWPLCVSVISRKDMTLPFFNEMNVLAPTAITG